MSNPWFRMYAEFATDAKVQMLPETMQRRLIMILCLRCSNALVTLQDAEIAFQLRITDQELSETKALFVSKKFVDADWNVLNWDKRQFKSDSSNDRVAKHRALQKQEQQKAGNGDVTLRKQKANALDTDTDTDTDTKDRANALVGKPTVPNTPVQQIMDLYNEILVPELPAATLINSKRKRETPKFWLWVMTSSRSDGKRRAETADEGISFIRSYFERAKENDFVMGRTPKAKGHESWEAGFDYLISEAGRVQVVEKTR